MYYTYCTAVLIILTWAINKNKNLGAMFIYHEFDVSSLILCVVDFAWMHKVTVKCL